MNTKRLTNGKDDIEIKIDILYKAINKYRVSLDLGIYTEEYLIDIKTKLKREEENLAWYKEHYAEYFI